MRLRNSFSGRMGRTDASGQRAGNSVSSRPTREALGTSSLPDVSFRGGTVHSVELYLDNALLRSARSTPPKRAA